MIMADKNEKKAGQQRNPQTMDSGAWTFPESCQDRRLGALELE